MRSLLLRYTQALITQTSQTAVCNAHHSVDQRLCRWLLLAVDRNLSRELVVTQDLVASMLGVGRVEVMDAVMKLQQTGLVDYRNGLLVVLNRDWLEERACECYAVIRQEFGRFLGLDWDWRPMPESVWVWSTANMGASVRS